MRDKDIRGIMEAYDKVYDQENVLSEANPPQNDLGARTGRALANTASDLVSGTAQALGGNFKNPASARQSQRWQNIGKFITTGQMPGSSNTGAAKPTTKPAIETPAQREARISKSQDAAIAAADKAEAQQRQGSGGGTNAARPTPPSAQAASGPVLSKLNGVEGTGVGANFKPRAFTDAEKSRYAALAAKNAPTSSSTQTAAPKAAAPQPAIGTLGSTKYQIRTPTSAELQAAQTARNQGASPEQALQAAQKTNIPTTGPTPAIPDIKSVNADLTKANANINKPAPAGTALAKYQASNPVKTAPTPTQVAGASQGIVPATQTTNQMKKQQLQQSHLDLFDLVVGHLLDEGYAETEEAAIVMMANMSEEWRDSVLESYGVDIQETKKWIQQAIKHPGALHRKLHVPQGEKIPAGKLAAAAKKGGKLGQEARLAKTLKGFHESKGDGNLANNYPPYDKVTRGDIIAGALGQDQMGGKNKTNKTKKSKKG
jgi:hypothetical protein